MAEQSRRLTAFHLPVIAIPLSAVERLLRRVSLTCLRVSLGVVFIWFGALKVTGVSPVGHLVAVTVPFADPHWFVPALGWLEVALGMGLLIGRSLHVVVLVLVAHLAGTFLVLLTNPGLAFQHGNPLELTTIGEFVVKNVVLISAGLVIAARRRTDDDVPAPR